MANCEDCGQDHDSIDALLGLAKRAKFRYWIATSIYFAAVLTVTVGAGLVIGLGGVLMTVGAFFFYLAHANMRSLEDSRHVIKNAIRERHHRTNPNPTKQPDSGHYL